MKTKILLGWKWTLTVGSAAMLLGCLDQTRETNAQSVTTEVAAQAIVAPGSETDTAPTRAIIPPANLSPGIAEVVKLAESGVSEEVLAAYVEKANQSFNPTVDEIVYLKDIGVSESVVAAMVRHEIVPATTTPEIAENKTAPQPNATAPAAVDSSAPANPIAAEPNYSNAAAAVPPTQEVNINYFENTLSPYGNWVEVAGYGRCWQPTVVVINRSWRPYGDRGRWIYTSSGWYWQSDYSWGWAPFHYGRWHNDSRVGWVWVPGSTWGPAWVSWRYTDDYCGWAPLPPTAHYVSGFGFRFHNSHVGINFDFGLTVDCYTFIPTTRFCDRSPNRYYVSGSHTKTIYKNSVVINNYINGNNNTIVNEGIGRDRIVKATHKPIQAIPLRELPATANPIGHADRIVGNNLSVFRPKVSASGMATTATTQNSIAPNRSIRSITKTTTSPTAQVQVPATSTTSGGQPQKLFTRNNSSTSVTRHLPSKVEQPVSAPAVAQTPEIKSTESATHTVITTRPKTGASPLRNLPAQSSSQEHAGNVGLRELNAVPENPRSLKRNNPSVAATATPLETRIVTPNVTRSEPRFERSERPQPVLRESAPAPVQNFNPPTENRVRSERSVPQASPSVRASEPSVRQTAPRPEAPARTRSEKPAAQNGRSDRNRS